MPNLVIMIPEITFEERKRIQLEMLKEIDFFCRQHNIRYSLAFGTLLGAIRHKGFIPWDDDVDIMMPLPDMLRFKKEFQSERLKFCDVDTERHYDFAFSRIAHKNTYNKSGLTYKSYGICIDTYPFVSIPDTEDLQNVFFRKALSFKATLWRKWRLRFIRRFPIATIPFFDKAIRGYRDYMFNTIPYGTSKTYYVIAGPIAIREKMTYDCDLFNSLIEVEFESYKFLAIEKYDLFLRKRYGDYMQLPPEAERHPYHGGCYYWTQD